MARKRYQLKTFQTLSKRLPRLKTKEEPRGSFGDPRPLAALVKSGSLGSRLTRIGRPEKRVPFAIIVDPFYHHNDSAEHEQNHNNSGQNFLQKIIGDAIVRL